MGARDIVQTMMLITRVDDNERGPAFDAKAVFDCAFVPITRGID